MVRQRTATPSPPVRIWVAPPKPSAYAGGFSYAGSCLSAFWKDNKKTWAGRPGPYHDRGQQPEPLSCITPGGVTPQLIRRGRPATRRVCERRDEPPFSGEFISPSSGWIETEPPRRIASGGSPLDIPTAKCYNNRQDAAKRQAVQSFRYGVPQKGVLP